MFWGANACGLGVIPSLLVLSCCGEQEGSAVEARWREWSPAEPHIGAVLTTLTKHAVLRLNLLDFRANSHLCPHTRPQIPSLPVEIHL